MSLDPPFDPAPNLDLDDPRRGEAGSANGDRGVDGSESATSKTEVSCVSDTGADGIPVSRGPTREDESPDEKELRPELVSSSVDSGDSCGADESDHLRPAAGFNCDPTQMNVSVRSSLGFRKVRSGAFRTLIVGDEKCRVNVGRGSGARGLGGAPGRCNRPLVKDPLRRVCGFWKGSFVANQLTTGGSGGGSSVVTPSCDFLLVHVEPRRLDRDGACALL